LEENDERSKSGISGATAAAFCSHATAAGGGDVHTRNPDQYIL
jgi:hypothetical protein